MGLKLTTCILLSLIFYAAQKPGQPANARSRRDLASKSADDLSTLRSELSKYRSWTLVNPKPMSMDPVVAAACAAPNIKTGPHTNKFILVYVNDIGRESMLSALHPVYPTGSIIVKEKLTDETSRTPELLTIMVKRRKGFDEKNGDWDYLVSAGDLSLLERPKNVESCQACHLTSKSGDYVSRIYLPPDVRRNLK